MILFRGKRIDNGEWVEGHYKYHPFYNIHLICFYEKEQVLKDQCPDGTWRELEVHRSSVGQFIGLTDKNGVKIFGSIEIDGEMTQGGDKILTVPRSGSCGIIASVDGVSTLTRFVVWLKDEACFGWQLLDGTFHQSGFSLTRNNAETIFEVIGKAYEEESK